MRRARPGRGVTTESGASGFSTAPRAAQGDSPTPAATLHRGCTLGPGPGVATAASGRGRVAEAALDPPRRGAPAPTSGRVIAGPPETIHAVGDVPAPTAGQTTFSAPRRCPRAEASPWGMWISISALPISVWLRRAAACPSPPPAPQASGGGTSSAPARSSYRVAYQTAHGSPPPEISRRKRKPPTPSAPAFGRWPAGHLFTIDQPTHMHKRLSPEAWPLPPCPGVWRRVSSGSGVGMEDRQAAHTQTPLRIISSCINIAARSFEQASPNAPIARSQPATGHENPRRRPRAPPFRGPQGIQAHGT